MSKTIEIKSSKKRTVIFAMGDALDLWGESIGPYEWVISPKPSLQSGIIRDGRALSGYWQKVGGYLKNATVTAHHE